MNRLSTCLVALSAAGLGCQGKGSQETNPANVPSLGSRIVAPESLQLAAPMIRLLREQRRAADPSSLMEAILCETIRLQAVHGEKAGNSLTAAAYAEAHRGMADSTLRRIDAAMANKTFRVGEGCDSLAKAGILGDTVFPPGPPPVR